MPDTDIVLTIDLDTADADKTAQQLQKEIESIFKSRNGQQSASLTSLELQLKKNVKAIQEVQQGMSEIGEQKIPTEGYQKLQEELQQITQEYEKLEEKRGKFGADRAEREALEKEFDAKADEAQAAYDRYQQLLKSYQQTPDNWRIRSDMENARVAMSGLNVEVEKLIEQLNQPKFTALDEMDEKALKLDEEIENLELKMKEMEDTGKAFMTVSPEETEEYQKLVRQRDLLIDKLKQELIKHEEIMRKEEERAAKSPVPQMGSELRGFNYEMTSLTSTLRGITRLIPGVNSTAIMGISMITRGLTRLVRLTKEQLVAALNTVKETIVKLFAMIAAHPILAAITAILAALAVLGVVLKKMYDKIKEQIEDLIELAKRGMKTVMGYAKEFLAYLTKNFLLIGTSIPRLFAKGIKLVVDKLKSLKSVIQENLEFMANWNYGNNRINASLKSISTSIQYMKVSLATMIAPLVDVIVPILSSIADKVNEITTNIGMFLAKLTGAKNFQRVIRQQKDFNKALKETNDQLSSLDDLNVINTDDNIIDFELVDLDKSPIADWFKDLKKAGKDTSTYITQLLESIPWEDIRAGVGKLAVDIADFINGFNETDWGEVLGKNIGEALNAISFGINTFLEQLDGKSLGEQIGNTLQTMIDTINFGDLGKALSESVNELAQIIQGITDMFNGEELGEKLSEFLQEALGGLNWADIKLAVEGIVEDLTGILNNLITPENLKLIGSTLGETLNTLFTGANVFADTAEWKEWGKSLGQGIDNFIKTTDWKLGGEAIGKMASGLTDSLLAAVNEITWTGEGSVAEAIINFLAGIPWKDLAKKAKEISESLREGLDSVWKELKTSGALDDIIYTIVTVLTEVNAWKKQLSKYKAELIWKAFWGQLAQGIDTVTSEIIKAIYAAIETISGLNPALKVILTPAINALKKQIPGYATGQVIPPSMSEHLALLGDNKHETEVVSPLSTMQEALYNALEQVGFNKGNQEIILNLDGREFMRAIVKQNNDYKKQHGGQSAFA